MSWNNKAETEKWKTDQKRKMEMYLEANMSKESMRVSERLCKRFFPHSSTKNYMYMVHKVKVKMNAVATLTLCTIYKGQRLWKNMGKFANVFTQNS